MTGDKKIYLRILLSRPVNPLTAMMETKAVVPSLPPHPPRSGVLRMNRNPVNNPASSIYQNFGLRFSFDIPVKLAQMATTPSWVPIPGTNTGKVNPANKPIKVEARTGPLPRTVFR